MSLLKPKIKLNTWSQIKRARRFLDRSFPGEKNPGVKSQAHLARIARRTVRRECHKQQEQAAAYATSQKQAAV